MTVSYIVPRPHVKQNHLLTGSVQRENIFCLVVVVVVV